MLDFYYVNVNEQCPEYPVEKNLIGQLDLDNFKLLHEVIEYLKLKGGSLKFFSDSELNMIQINTMLKFINFQ